LEVVLLEHKLNGLEKRLLVAVNIDNTVDHIRDNWLSNCREDLVNQLLIKVGGHHDV
jgi:hypothetical protein